MADFVWLSDGDILPAVAVAQLLLKRTGTSLAIDGDFGRHTRAAVSAFQSTHQLAADGVIGRQTWPRLRNRERLQILDCVDIFDDSFFSNKPGAARRQADSLYSNERLDLMSIHADPILIGGMCDGVEQAIAEIRSRAHNLFLLRFHGHGAPGLASASEGHGDIYDHSAFENDRETQQAFSRLRGAFGPYGCIQFMHCLVGHGHAGARFLRMVADAAGVPASGAYRTQYGGGLRWTLRYEGPVRTVCPGGVSLAAWARSLPEFVGMSVI